MQMEIELVLIYYAINWLIEIGLTVQNHSLLCRLFYSHKKKKQIEQKLMSLFDLLFCSFLFF